MTRQEFVEQVDYYFSGRGPGMTDKQSVFMMDFLVRYPENLMQSLFKSLIETCKTFPRVAHVKEAAHAAHIQPSEVSRESRGCPECNGLTWIYVKMWSEIYEKEIDAVRPCECTPRNIDQDPGPSDNDQPPF